jgi:hypothetical protein
MGDAVPGFALFYRCHSWPMLHFFKGAAAAFAKSVTLAGGANGDAGGVWRGVVPNQPRGHGFGGETVGRDCVLVVKHHQRVHLCQRPQLGAQGDAVGRGALVAPVVDGGFNVGDVDERHVQILSSYYHNAISSAIFKTRQNQLQS